MNAAAYLVQTGDWDGPMNMAIDELLWSMARQRQSFFRLYGWSDRPALSLGYFQETDQVRRDARLRDLPYVRRATGGGAIVHDREITYSLALPASLAPPTRQLYQSFHRAVTDALTELGIDATMGEGPVQDQSSMLCFQRHDRFAVRVGGVKVLGSAQRRHTDSVLMHGSLILASSPVLPELLGLAEVSGTECSVDTLSARLVQAAQTALSLEFKPIGRADWLTRRAASLADSKYRSAAWNDRRGPAPADSRFFGSFR